MIKKCLTFTPFVQHNNKAKGGRYMKLVIVESPTKCHTIQKYLGEDYKVMASLGHIRDLSTSGKGGLGVDVSNNFKPTYVNSKEKVKIIA